MINGMITDAGWAAIGLMATGFFGVLTSLISTRGLKWAKAANEQAREANAQATYAKEQSSRNSDQLTEVHDKVNGNLAAAVMAAKSQSSTQVLIIDDDDDDLELQAILLRKNGCEVFQCKRGIDAEELIRSRVRGRRGWPFDFVLLDIKLSAGETARDVIAMLDRVVPELPVAIITGNGSVPADLCSEGRFVISKPLTADHIRRIKLWLGLV